MKCKFQLHKHNAFSFMEMSIVMVITGILIAAIAQSSILIEKSKLFKAQVETSSSPLYKMKSLELWLETTLEESISEDDRHNEEVEKWNPINKTNIKKTISRVGGEVFDYAEEGAGGLPSVEISSENGVGELKVNNVYFLNDIEELEFTFIIAGMTREGDYSSASLFTCYDGDDGYVISLELPQSLSFGKPYIISYTATEVKDSDEVRTISYKTYVDGKEDQQPNDKSITPSDSDIEYCLIGDGGYQGEISEIILLSKKLEDNNLHEIHKYLSRKYDIDLD